MTAPPVTAFATTHDLADSLGTEKRSVALEQATDLIRAELGQDVTPSVRETITLLGTGRRLIQLPQLPVTAVTAVTVFGQPLAATVHWSWAVDGVLTRLYNRWHAGTPVVIDYTHGYPEVPAKLTRLCATLADKILAGTIDVRQESETLGTRSKSTTYARVSDSVFTDADMKILDAFRPTLLP